ncbi:MAG: SAM-dependent methyltransferase, partial [Deltaproteobacteria bacterium]|nr:SAM-dependent methyltransferase [Deltaproteobacteria bacterium]
TGNLKDMNFMDYRTTSLPYKLLNNPEVLIVGGGGGTEILNAKYHRAKNISVVEMNRDLIGFMQGKYRRFSGDIYNPQEYRIFAEDGRGYLQITKNRFDLIQICLLESMESASAGVYSLNENYLFTTESLKTCLDRLNPGGILSISRWIKNPPRDCIKLLITAIAALEDKNASESIIMIRSWQTATLLIKHGLFNKKEIGTVKNFCKSRLFDLCYYPGIKKEETNIVNRMDESYFFIAATRLLSGEREHFYNEYPFYIRPATDDRPFFGHFFKTAVLKTYLAPYGRISIPLIDWGYILVWTALGILVLLSTIFILAPIKLVRGSPRGKTPVFIYFGCLGLAYMFLEMSFLQQFIRYLYDPVFSASIVIGSFLIYSGIGSLIAGRMGTVGHKHVLFAVVFIVTVGIIYIKFDQLLENTLSGFSLWSRMLICSLLTAPLALPMGIPFPSGLSLLAEKGDDMIPWAWGINGFFSVIGASATVLIAIQWGFKSVVFTALTLYILSAVMYRQIGRDCKTEEKMS